MAPNSPRAERFAGNRTAKARQRRADGGQSYPCGPRRVIKARETRWHPRLGSPVSIRPAAQYRAARLGVIVGSVCVLVSLKRTVNTHCAVWFRTHRSRSLEQSVPFLYPGNMPWTRHKEGFLESWFAWLSAGTRVDRKLTKFSGIISARECGFVVMSSRITNQSLFRRRHRQRSQNGEIREPSIAHERYWRKNIRVTGVRGG